MKFMKRINNKGFGKIELMGVLGLLAVLIAIGAKMAVDTGKNYNGFKIITNQFLDNVALYKDRYTKNSSVYYLYELIEKGYSEEITNPMETSSTCDIYETYADIEVPNDKKVNIVCGNYLVTGSQQSGYKLYEVGEWTEKKKEGDTDASVIYNYRDEAGNLVFSEFYPETTFFQKYYAKNKTSLSGLSELKDKLETKYVYRKKTLIKELT